MPEKLKHIFFSDSFLDNLSKEIGKIYPEFDKGHFRSLVYNSRWKNMELKQRMRHIAECLFNTLPGYERGLDILIQVAPRFSGFDAMIFPDYVEAFGLDFRDISLPALWHFTKQCSSEFAIRPFLKQDLHATLQQMKIWADDEDPMVRRLASEGCRPRLPWAMSLPALKKDPRPILPILEKLKDDESETVRRSVANNLNDISKDNPQRVLELCRRWYGKSAETDKLIKHACRDLLKSGNTDALMLFGFAGPANIRVENLRTDKAKILIGEDLRFFFDLQVKDNKTLKLRLEYKVFYIKANGKYSPKIFQIRENSFPPGTHSMIKKHSFQDFSTRKHYPGRHMISVIVNGREKSKIEFDLK